MTKKRRTTKRPVKRTRRRRVQRTAKMRRRIDNEGGEILSDFRGPVIGRWRDR